MQHYKPTQTHTKQMNKNAYEIRLEILNLAHADMQNRFYEKLSLLKEAESRAYDSYLRVDSTLAPFTGNCTPEAIDALLPTSASILARAEELYCFIEGK